MLLLLSCSWVNNLRVLEHLLKLLILGDSDLLEQEQPRHHKRIPYLEDSVLQLRIKQEECSGSRHNNLKLRLLDSHKDFYSHN